MEGGFSPLPADGDAAGNRCEHNYQKESVPHDKPLWLTLLAYLTYVSNADPVLPCRSIFLIFFRAARFNGLLYAVLMGRIGVPVAAVLLAAALAVSCGGSSDSNAPSPSPTVSMVITARGRVGYVNSDGNFAVMNPDGSDQQPLTKEDRVAAFAWSPNGSMVALEMGSGSSVHVRVIQADGSAIFDRPGASQPLWSPRSDRLALISNAAVVVTDAGGNELRAISNAARPAWSPDGQSIAVVKLSGGKGVPVIVDLATGDEKPLAADIAPDDPVYPIAWHPAGNVIAYHDGLYEPSTGTKKPLPGVPVSWSPDGRILMVTLPFDPAYTDIQARLMDATQDFKQIIGLDVRDTNDGLPAWLSIQRWTDWSADGRILLDMDPQPSRERVRIFDTVAVSQMQYKNIKGERPDISPDSKFAVFMDSDKVWTLSLDGKNLIAVADGSLPAWQPVARQ